MNFSAVEHWYYIQNYFKSLANVEFDELQKYRRIFRYKMAPFQKLRMSSV